MNFFDLGGYGQFIWTAYGFTAVVLIGVMAQSLRFQIRTDMELAALQGVSEPANGERAEHEAQA